MKYKKIISILLVYCLLFQLPFAGLGCTSFYSAKGIINLEHFKDYDREILIKLEDNSELQIAPKQFYFVNKPTELIFGTGKVYDFINRKSSDFSGAIQNDIIDSNSVISVDSSTYHFFWTKDSKKYIFENSEFIKITQDSGKYFWIVRDDNTGKFRKIKNSSIQEIQVQEDDIVSTGLLAATAMTLLYICIGVAALISFLKLIGPLLS